MKKFLSLLLKILLGILIFALFLLFLPLMLFIILMPIRYHVDVNNLGDLKMNIKVRYIFGLIKFIFIKNDDETVSKLTIAGKQLGNTDSAKSKKTKGAAEQKKAKAVKEAKRNVKKQENNTGDEESEGLREKLSGVQRIIGIIRAVWEHPDRPRITKQLFAMLHQTLLVFKPKYFKAEGIVGFEDPATTGLALGAVQAVAVNSKFVEKFEITPDFYVDKTSIKAHVIVKGSISVGRLSWPFIKFIFKKPVRNVIFEYIIRKMRKKDEGATE